MFFYIKHRKYKGERHEGLCAKKNPKKPTVTNTPYVKQGQYVEFQKKGCLEVLKKTVLTANRLMLHIFLALYSYH